MAQGGSIGQTEARSDSKVSDNSETAKILFSKGDLSSSFDSAERTADVMVDNAKTEKDHQRQALKGDLRTVVRAMSAQKEYDKRTVEAVTNLAKQLLKDQSIDALSRRVVNGSHFFYI